MTSRRPPRRFDTIDEQLRPEPAAGSGAPDAIVNDLDHELAIAPHEADSGVRRARRTSTSISASQTT